MSGKKTPRHLIQEYADNVDTEKSIHPVRRRRPLSRSPEVTSLAQSTVSSTTQDSVRSGKKRKTNLEEDEEFTPRHLIQGVLDTHDTAKPSTRKTRRVTELLPPASNKVKKSRRRSSLGVPTLEKMADQFTPRSMITGFLDQGAEETPEQRTDKRGSSGVGSSYGDIPSNEISFHPVEASFHKSKFEKVEKKTRGGRSRAGIQIVRRKSEKLARRADQELDFSNEEESDNTELEEIEAERELDQTGRKSDHAATSDIEDTSAKDTSSVDPSPRKSLSHRKPAPSKRQSIASVKNASTFEHSLPMSPLSGDLASRETTPDETPSETETPLESKSLRKSVETQEKTPRGNGSKSSNARNLSKADEIYDVENNKKDSSGEASLTHADVDETSPQKSEEIGTSDLQRSPRRSKFRAAEASKSRNIFDTMQQHTLSFSNQASENKETLPNRHEKSHEKHASSLGLPADTVKRSQISATESWSRSLSRSKMSDRMEVDEGSSAEMNDDDEDDNASVEVQANHEDLPRSGRSSPRNSTGLATNVYDFHDDSPSKRIIGKLSKTLQKSATEDEDYGDIDSISLNNDEAAYRNISDSDSGNDDEPEESIIPTVDKVTRTFYTPLRTPHLKERSSGKPVSMVTSTPKPPSLVEKQAAKPKGKAKTSGKKKDAGYMPTSVVKGLFTHFCPSKVSKDAIAEVEKASAIFWENAAKDLESYTLHAHRKTIEEADVELLMKRQKFITPKESLPALVEKYLPLELRQEIIPICRSGNKIELK